MTDVTAAIGAIGAEPKTTRSTFGTVITIPSPTAEAGAGPGLKEAFRTTMETFQSVGSSLEAVNGTAPALDPVAAAKERLVAPAGANGEPAAASAAAGGDGSAMLRKSFDHALFVTLVSQIVSGAGQATSTLIKQQ